MLATALARELPRFDVALIQARSASECVFNFPANLKEN